MVVIADRSKLVEALGAFPLSIEVNRFGLAGHAELAVERVAALHHAEAAVKLRLTAAGEPLVDRWRRRHSFLDAFFGRISNPEALSSDLHGVPGVVEHGLFLRLCRRAYVAGPDGVETIDA